MGLNYFPLHPSYRSEIYPCRHMKHPFLLLAAGVFLAATCFGALTPEDIRTKPHADIEKALPSEHPSAYYGYAARLFAEGKRDESIFWFYAGQIRYRVHLRANPTIDPSGDPALFSSLSATVGRQINEYAGGDPRTMFAHIQKALDWDAATPNGFTSKTEFKEVYEEIRAGLMRMKASMEQNIDALLDQRRKAGLEVRAK